MAQEEFEESEIVFDQSDEVNIVSCNSPLKSPESKRKKVKRDKKSSVPMTIPENNVARSRWFRYVDSDIDGGDAEMVPPHVIIGRRVAGKIMAFSVCTGNGRTLKGRDLSEFRNSILRLTGFLET